MGFGPLQGSGAIQDMGSTQAIPNQFGIDTTGHQSGLLGGIIADQKRAMAQQMFDQSTQANQMDLAQQALTLKQHQADEDTNGANLRALTAAKTSDDLDLYKNGVMQAVHSSKLLSDLTANQLQAITDHYKEQQQQLDTGRQQASLLDPQTGQLPLGMADQINKQRQQLNMPALPDDPADAAAQLRSEEQQALHTGPRLDAAITAANAAKLKKQEEDASQKIEDTKAASASTVANIQLGKMSTDQRMSNLQEQWQQNPSSLNSNQISALQNFLVTKDSSVFNTVNSKLDQIQNMTDDPKLRAQLTENMRRKEVPGYSDLADAKVVAQKKELAQSNAAALQKAAATPQTPTAPAAQADQAATPISADVPPSDVVAKAGKPPAPGAKLVRKNGQWGWSW